MELKRKMKIEEYKNCFEGKKAIIMGNGPSLSKIDLKLLQKNQIVSFATNRVSLLYKDTDWRPDYYSCFVSSTPKEWRESISTACKEKKTTCFVHKRFSSFVEDSGNVNFVKNVFEHYRNGPIPKDLFDISVEDKFVKSYTAVVPLYQLCFYMGIKKIGIIGQDGYKGHGSDHFAKSYGQASGNSMNPDKARKINDRYTRLHKVIKKHAVKNDIQIYNLSKQSIIKEYEIIELEEFITCVGEKSEK